VPALLVIRSSDWLALLFLSVCSTITHIVDSLRGEPELAAVPMVFSACHVFGQVFLDGFDSITRPFQVLNEILRGVQA